MFTIALERFRTVTPIRFTSSGSWGSAVATRFCTSMSAVSASVPSAKVTSSWYWPLLDAVLAM